MYCKKKDVYIPLCLCISVLSRRACPRKGKKQRVYNQNNLNIAVQCVKSGAMSLRKAALFYGVPFSTIHARIKQTERIIEEAAQQ